MKKKRNNKGFSLVELIVVMAIMAILAVTLAPRLFKYVDKARQANDRELVNTIYTTVQNSLLEDGIYKSLYSTSGSGSSETITSNVGTTTKASGVYTTVIKLHGNSLYSTSGKDWTKGTSTNKFIAEIYDIIDNFKLQSDKAKSTADIVITITSNKTFTVQLDYDTTDGTASDVSPATYDYELNSANAS